MNERKRPSQMTLFSTGAPRWDTFAPEVQRCLVDTLSQMLLQARGTDSGGSNVESPRPKEDSHDE